MIDLETMSTQSNAAIVSIGAVKFSVKGIEDTHYINVSLEDSMSHGLHIDGKTVMWWLSQSDKARQALNQDAGSLIWALSEFTSWIGGKDIQVWGNGATFDNVVLANAYKACKLPMPWSFRNDRCYRTMKNMFPDVPYPKTTGTLHNALDDATFQAEHLIEIFKKIGYV